MIVLGLQPPSLLGKGHSSVSRPPWEEAILTKIRSDKGLRRKKSKLGEERGVASRERGREETRNSDDSLVTRPAIKG